VGQEAQDQKEIWAEIPKKEDAEGPSAKNEAAQATVNIR